MTDDSGEITLTQSYTPYGEVTLATSYTPWGDTLEIHGTGNFSLGYLSGITHGAGRQGSVDTATGLLYVGSGQYYDPSTGRFLTREAKADQTNPYVPWEPSTSLIAPLALLMLIFGRKKKRGKWDGLIIALVMVAAGGMSLTACSKTVTTSTGTAEIIA